MAAHPAYVQYGAGLCAPDGWMNFDASLRARLETFPLVGRIIPNRLRLFPRNLRYGNIVDGLDVLQGSVRGVYASHVLEHIPHDSLQPALRNTLHMLVAGGVFRLIVPNLRERAARYLERATSSDSAAANAFLEGTGLGRANAARGFSGLVRQLFGNAHHLWMYDAISMKSELAQAGFVDIRDCSFGDSDDAMFSRVEDRGRFVDGDVVEVALEARAPRAR